MYSTEVQFKYRGSKYITEAQCTLKRLSVHTITEAQCTVQRLSVEYIGSVYNFETGWTLWMYSWTVNTKTGFIDTDSLPLEVYSV